MGRGQLPVGRSFRQARFGGKTKECSLVCSMVDKLMVNRGLTAPANMSKVNIWGWLLPRSMQNATFMPKICICNICILYVLCSSNIYCAMCVLCMQYALLCNALCRCTQPNT